MRVLTSLFLMASACLASTSQQAFFGGAPDANLANTGTNYYPISGQENNASGTTAAAAYVLWPTNGQLYGLCVNLATAPGASASWKFQFYDNGTAETATAVIASAVGATCVGVSASFAVSAGDLVCIQETVNAGSPTVSKFSFFFLFSPTILGETAWFASGQPAASTTEYFFVAPIGFNATESLAQTVAPMSGTAEKLYGYVATAFGASVGYTFTMDKNSSGQTPTCSLQGAGSGSGITTCNDTTHSFSVTSGNTLDIKVAPIGSPTPQVILLSFVVLATTPGQFPILNTRVTPSLATQTNYMLMEARFTTVGATEAQEQQVAGVAIVIQAIYATQSTAPGGSASYTYTLDVGGSASSLTVTVSGTTSPASNSTTGASVLVQAQTLLDTKSVPNSSPAAQGNLSLSYLAYIAPAGSGLLPAW